MATDIVHSIINTKDATKRYLSGAVWDWRILVKAPTPILSWIISGNPATEISSTI